MPPTPAPTALEPHRLLQPPPPATFPREVPTKDLSLAQAHTAVGRRNAALQLLGVNGQCGSTQQCAGRANAGLLGKAPGHGGCRREEPRVCPALHGHAGEAAPGPSSQTSPSHHPFPAWVAHPSCGVVHGQLCPPAGLRIPRDGKRAALRGLSSAPHHGRSRSTAVC